MSISRIRERLAPALVAGAAAALLASGVPGCSGGSSSRPRVAMDDREAHTQSRIETIRDAWPSVERGDADAGLMRENLKRVAWSRSTFHTVRVAAIEELIRDEKNDADTRTMLGLMLPTETDWFVINFVCDQAATRGWVELAPALVRSWSRPVHEPPDNQRPERAALAALYPQRTPLESVFAVFAGETTGRALTERERRDAWGLLRRIDPDSDRVRDLLTGVAGTTIADDPFLEALVPGARDLGAVPDTAEQLAWLSRLRDPSKAQFWQESARAIASLSPEQRAGLELRHAAVIRWAAANRSEWVGRSREELLGTVERRLSGRKHYSRVRESPTGMPDDLFRHWRSKLAWADALTILVALEAMDDQNLPAALFAQADIDHNDRSTEHGGILDAAPGGGFAARHFPPRPTQRVSDQVFIASIDMIEAGDTGLFHYHFHANSHGNRDYAGPSREDITAAANLGRSSLVLSFINKNTLNADYYQPDGAKVDLGEIMRPDSK